MRIAVLGGAFDPIHNGHLQIAKQAVKQLRASYAVYRPIVYICSPYAGDIECHIRRAQGYCRFAVSKNCIPIAPHLLFPQFMEEDDPEQRRLGIFFGLILQKKCKEVWVFGRNISRGMAVEIEKAKERGLPIRFFDDRCRDEKSA